MKKHTFSRVLSMVLCLVLALSAICLPAYAEKGGEATERRGAITDEDMLHTKGKKIYNKRGEEVILRGVNLGTWLIQESWMTPIENSDDNISTLNTLTERFGVEKAYELINIYEDNWITEYDLDKIVELGFNCVRVPFWFRNFYYDDKGTKILDENGEWDFSRLDWVVSECSKRGLYVILDLHGAPGYQNNKDHCGKIGDSGLFKLTKQAEEWRKLTIELWVAIAKRFSGNPAVAMYDLLNEPNCDVSSYLQKNNLVTISVYNRLYKAIREVDKDHIMTMEGIWRLYNLPAPCSSAGLTLSISFISMTQATSCTAFSSSLQSSIPTMFRSMSASSSPWAAPHGITCSRCSKTQTSAGLSGHIRLRPRSRHLRLVYHRQQAGL